MRVSLAHTVTMDQAIKTATETFDMFIWNNVHQGRRYGVEDLLEIDKERQFRYTMAGKHYLATVSRMEMWKGPCVSIVVRCPLPEIERHEGSWVSKSLMGDGIGKHFFGAGFWYSACPEGNAFVLGPKDMRNLHCKITFVRSEPFNDPDQTPP